MKGFLSCMSTIYQNIYGFKKHFVEEICQEVLTLHLLTITLRRNSNPPGFFCCNYITPVKPLGGVVAGVEIKNNYFL